MHRIFTTSVASVYPHYVTKAERKGRTQAEVDEVIEWLTGFDEATLRRHLAEETTFADFFGAATLNPHVDQITCGDGNDRVVKRAIDQIMDPGQCERVIVVRLR